ncbi:hypothetical protein D3C85_1372300 [compost metagenome]
MVVFAPKKEEWNGTGLPPVGVVCEAKSTARGSERDWFKSSVNYISEYTVVLDDGKSGEFVAHPATMQFRPIRTPEQIAADEREAAMEHMRQVMEGSSSKSWVEALYDAGYRRSE